MFRVMCGPPAIDICYDMRARATTDRWINGEIKGDIELEYD